MGTWGSPRVASCGCQESLIFRQPHSGPAEPPLTGYPFAQYRDGDPVRHGVVRLPDKSYVDQFKQRPQFFVIRVQTTRSKQFSDDGAERRDG